LFDALIDEAAAEHDVVTRMYSLATKGFMLAFVVKPVLPLRWPMLRWIAMQS
jgi:hypothetical protein